MVLWRVSKHFYHLLLFCHVTLSAEPSLSGKAHLLSDWTNQVLMFLIDKALCGLAVSNYLAFHCFLVWHLNNFK